MADTTFTNGVTLTDSDWFNDVNRLHYTIFGDPADVPTVKGVVNPTLGTEVATTSGTIVALSTTIPTWARRVTINLVGVSTNGTSPLMIQIGDAGGIENTGYIGTAFEAVAAGNAASNMSSGFLLHTVAAAAGVYHGTAFLHLENLSGFMWVFTSTMGNSNEARIATAAGRKATSQAMDRISITTSGGTDTFDAGAINILYE